MTDNISPLGEGWRKNVEKSVIKDTDSETCANVITRDDGNNAVCVDVRSDIQIGAVELKDHDSELRVDVNTLGSGDNALVVETTPSADSVQNIRVQDGDGTDLADVITRDDGNNALCVDVRSDIQIGAVEIKNADTDDRVAVLTDGTDMALTVRANDLDIRDLAFASDSVDVSGSSVNVTATDLDIRDIDNATDDILVYGYSELATSNEKLLTDIDGANVGIEHSHYEVHKGRMFVTTHKFSSVADSGTGEILVVCDNSWNPHIDLMIYCDGKHEIDIFEQPTVTSNGTAVSSPNMDRRSANTTNTNFYHTPTTTADGTQILNLIGGGGSSVFTRVGGEAKLGSEFIFKEGYTYLIRITNNSGNTADISFYSEHYEEAV